ncbi:MAG: hypothetical protein V3V35_00130, partial [Dehalococcoidia bacterium]
MVKTRRGVFLAGALVVILVVASCGASSGGETTDNAAPAPKVLGQGQLAAGSLDGLPSHDPDRAAFEAYWYSRYNLGQLVMRSGLGVRFMPPMEKVQQMMEMAGIPQGPANPFLLLAPFASGDPHWVQPFNGSEDDFSNFRWDTATMDTTVTPQAIGQTITKEVIWAKAFASDIEGPVPMNHFRALVLSAEAAAQAQFALANLRSPEGLLVSAWRDGQIADSAVKGQDQVVMLWALSELADYASGAYGWYGAPLTGDQASAMADDLLAAILRYAEDHPGFLAALPSRDLGVALSALSAYASYTSNESQGARVAEQVIPSLARELTSRMDQRGKLGQTGRYRQAATQGAVVSGLVFAYKVTGAGAYREDALRAWRYLETLWDGTVSVYRSDEAASRYVYTARDVGDVVGAFNALINGLNIDVEQRFADFFDGALNRSGLQIAEAAPTGGGQDADAIPDPFSAGGESGQAPVLATEVAYDTTSGQWSVTNPRFTT